MTALKFSGPVLGEQGEEVRDLYVVDGRITFEPQAGAQTVAPVAENARPTALYPPKPPATAPPYA